MSTHTMVKLPDGTTELLADLETETVLCCDGCQHHGEATEFIPVVIRVEVSDKYGEGTTIQGHICGRAGCQLSAMIRHFEALWPLPEVEARP